MISITVKKLVELAETQVLTKFYNLDKPVNVAWKNRHQPKVCNEALKDYTDKRLALCEQYGKKDPASNNYFFDVDDDLKPLPGVPVPGPQRRAFDEALAELKEQTVELPGDPVKVTALKGSLTDIECEMLEPFITD